MELELIERYLNNEMDGEERQKFEDRMERQPHLEEDVKTVAYIIHAIREKGIEQDNDRIDAIRRSVSSDHKRYVISAAAMFAVLFAIAAIVSVPVYKHVIKPIIERNELPKNAPSSSIFNTTDTLSLVNDNDTIISESEDSQPVETVRNNEDINTNDPKSIEEPTVDNSIEANESQKKQEETAKEEEAQKAKVPSPTISSLTDKNGTRYKIVSVRAKDEGIIVTLQLSNNDDQYMIKLKGVSIVDSRNNRTKSSQIKANGKYSSNFVLNMSETTTVEIFFYGIKGKPSYLQLLQIQEDDSHSTLQFKNLEIK